jgi:S1-C subfamily serine protease
MIAKLRGCVLVLLAAGIVAGGCGGQSSAAPQAPVSAPASAPDAGNRPVARPGRIARRDMMPVLSGGLGAFLSRIEVKPAATKGRFGGWQIVALHWEGTSMAGVDLQPGDVVTSVNGRPIERPEQALSCWQTLAVARELRVSFERGNDRRELFYPIDDEPPAAK